MWCDMREKRGCVARFVAIARVANHGFTGPLAMFYMPLPLRPPSHVALRSLALGGVQLLWEALRGEAYYSSLGLGNCNTPSFPRGPRALRVYVAIGLLVLSFVS